MTPHEGSEQSYAVVVRALQGRLTVDAIRRIASSTEEWPLHGGFA